MNKGKFTKVVKENQLVITSSDGMSKCAKRKFTRYGKNPANRRSSSSESAGFTQTELFDLGLHVQCGTQAHLWRRGEEMAKLYKLKRMA